MELRNIAIIAHVDHGKTTLVDGLLKQSHTFQAHESYMNQDLILDSNDQERERGITILAKNTAISYEGTKINIIDTPGHADFGGEVERTLNMADGVLLLVDAQEGPMPQTKFVLKKALGLGLKTIVVINKIDKKDANIDRTISRVYDLFLDLVSDESQLEFPVLYAIGRDEKAWKEFPTNPEEDANLTPIFEAILEYIPAPKIDLNSPFKMQVTTLAWDAHKGKYAIGRVLQGKAQKGMSVNVLKENNVVKAKIDTVFVNKGLSRVEVSEGLSGDIVTLSGISDADIGDTICDVSITDRLPALSLEEPTVSIAIGANTSPFMGREGDFVNSRQILERIQKELQTNIAMKFEKDQNGQFIISGRGELHLSVFLETLRREGYEIEVGPPKVITKAVDGVEMEPYEEITIDVENDFVGAIQSEMGQRRATLVNHEDLGSHTSRLIFEASTRALLGLASVLNTLSKGTAVVSSSFIGYRKINNSYSQLRKGALIASADGKAAVYGLRIAQDNGVTFISPSEEVYKGMIIGLNSRDQDLEINVAKGKALSNVRSQGEEAIVIAPPQKMSLEQCLTFLEADELLEVTPKSLRLRKKILDSTLRNRAKKSS